MDTSQINENNLYHKTKNKPHTLFLFEKEMDMKVSTQETKVLINLISFVFAAFHILKCCTVQVGSMKSFSQCQRLQDP